MESRTKLAEARKIKGLSQTDLARTLGIPQARLAIYESGREVPSFERAAAIAGALGVSIRDLGWEVEAEARIVRAIEP